MSDNHNPDPISKKAWLILWLLLLAGLYIFFDDPPKRQPDIPYRKARDAGRLNLNESNVEHVQGYKNVNC